MRHMDYVFPGHGYEAITDQFMLGNDILVAPVLTESTYTRKVHLPEGQWEYTDGTIYQGGSEIEVPAPLDTLPFFIKR